MTHRSRFLVLWIVFAIQAFALATIASWNTRLVDVAMLVAFIVGLPLAMLLAVAGCRKRLLFATCFGTGLIVLSIGLAMLLFGGNPVIIVVLITFSAGLLWLVAPTAPLGNGRTSCITCGYSLMDLRGTKCPECGTSIRNMH